MRLLATLAKLGDSQRPLQLAGQEDNQNLQIFQVMIDVQRGKKFKVVFQAIVIFLLCILTIECIGMSSTYKGWKNLNFILNLT